VAFARGRARVRGLARKNCLAWSDGTSAAFEGETIRHRDARIRGAHRELAASRTRRGSSGSASRRILMWLA